MQRSSMFIPPGGFLGAASNTQAGQAALGTRRSGNGGARRKRRKSPRRAKPTRTSSKRSSKLKRMVKGSAAAKAYMAKLRKKRRK